MSRIPFAVLAALTLVVASCGGKATDVAPNGPSSERLTLRPVGSVEGTPAGYIEYLPPGYGDGTRRPLLLFFHGAGENGDGGEDGLKLLRIGGAIPTLIARDRWPERRPFIVLMPQHDGGQVAGSLCPDAAEIDSFIRFATANYDVDAKRVYLTGLSCGAIGAWEYLGAHTDETVAAAVLIAGDGNHAFAEAHCALGR